MLERFARVIALPNAERYLVTELRTIDRFGYTINYHKGTLRASSLSSNKIQGELKPRPIEAMNSWISFCLKTPWKILFNSEVVECITVWSYFFTPQETSTLFINWKWEEANHLEHLSCPWSASEKVASSSPNSLERDSAWPLLQKVWRLSPLVSRSVVSH